MKTVEKVKEINNEEIISGNDKIIFDVIKNNTISYPIELPLSLNTKILV